jgi:lipoprotein NlpD
MPFCQPDWGERMEKIKPSTLMLVFFILPALFLILSCFSPQIQKTQTMGVYHRVKKNETVQMIANAYHVRLQNLTEMNNATDLNSIKEGDVLFIPEATQVIDNINTNVKTTDTMSDLKTKKEPSPVTQTPIRQQSKVVAPEKPAPLKNFSGESISEGRVESKSNLKNAEEEIKIDKNRFIWPVRGGVKTSFGIQPNKTYNNWIKIVSNAGTKVKAAASGTVIFSSVLKNYGETVIIRHKDNFATVYTHLRKRYVRIDQTVKKGDVIALMAETDDTGEAFINFEIRLQGKARNPILFLP